MLLGREPEQQRIAELVAGARLGQSGVLVLHGEAGIGKTALLDDTASRAGDMAVLRAAGTDAESALAFSGLHQLLRPALHLLDRLPAPQADALAVALMLRAGATPERFAVGAATLSLLSRHAEDRPLLILVDDAHLLDPPSADALRFVARRLLADPVAIVISTRPEAEARFTDLPTVHLGGLTLAATSALLSQSVAIPATAEDAAHLHRVTLGSPLAIVELAGELDRIRDTPDELPMPVTETVAAVFGRRVTALDDATRLALLLAVVADGDLGLASRAASATGASIASIAAAESAGLLKVSAGRAEFRHPLVRSAIYRGADPQSRREVHRAVAQALPAAAQARRVWHLSEAAIGADDDVADQLAAVAETYCARGAYGVAVRALVRSAELTNDDALRCGRLVAAAEAAWFSGQSARAGDLLVDAETITDDARRLTDIAALRGTIALRTGSLRDARDLLVDAARRAESVDPQVAVALLGDAVTACFCLCDTASGLVAADRIEALLPSCTAASTQVRGELSIGIARILAGEDGLGWLRSAVTTLSETPSVLDDPRRPDWPILGTLFLRESAVGRDLVTRVVQDRRDRIALGSLPNLLFHVARDEATTDKWQSALADYGESAALARETGQTTDLAAALAGLAWLQARMGRADECLANAAEAQALAKRNHMALAEIWAQYALGDLALATGDAAAACRHYEELSMMLSDIGFRDVDVSPAPELVEACVRSGREDTAEAIARDYLRRAEEKCQPWALARAHRAMALVNPTSVVRARHLDEALRLHDLNPDTFEAARTRLVFGSSLRRAKQRVAARPHLRRALEDFQRLGARPWAELAATELDATGERARRSADGYSAHLTPQELRIAQMLGDGATTKEAAAALFLSPKTVEYHLRHVYQKLGIRSRDELRTVIATQPR
ncbi:AAA family ATPase [Mycolicibacterium rutilum]|nr:helix-turn-helix transcriptional regulator [Mycolicibacterium rutilum]